MEKSNIQVPYLEPGGVCVPLLLRLVTRGWMGARLALPGADPGVDGGHRSGCRITG